MKSKYSKEFLQSLVDRCESKAEIIKEIGLTLSGGNYKHIAALLKIYEIDTTNLTGQHWAKNKTIETSTKIKKLAKEDILQDKTERRRNLLYRAMLESAIGYKCNICQALPIWMEKPITLHIDHIDGNDTNNTLINLQFLCPNCHQQTITWGNNKNKRVRNPTARGT